jgi:hypothetical protein
LVFDSERFENYDNGARARETYDIVSADEFIETFELDDPGQPLEVYSRTHFKLANWRLTPRSRSPKFESRP